jgi:ribonuclease Z
MLAFITDAAQQPGTADFASHVRLLVHEAWRCEDENSDAERPGLDAHSSAESAARVAKEADVGELLLSHLPPVDEDYHAAMLARARAIFPRTDLCSDGMSRHLE